MTDNRKSGDWQQCAPGELSNVAAVLRSQQNRKQSLAAFGKAAVAVSLVVAAVVGVQSIQRRDGGDMNYGGISCTDVRSQAADYVAQRLAPGLIDKFEAHLSRCPMCQEYVEQLRREQTAAPATVTASVAAMTVGSSSADASAASAQSDRDNRRFFANAAY